MASGLLFGKVKAVNNNSLLLDSGDWLSLPRDYPAPDVGSNVIASYWTKNSQYNGQWRTFRNAVHIRVLAGKVDFRQLQEAFVEFGKGVEVVPYVAPPPAADLPPAAAYDDIPF